jgi:ankyrin repeat protein
MNEDLTELLESIKGVPDFYGIEFNSINDTNAFGDNALHCVCVWGDIAAAKLLIEHGIEINQRGEGDLTPLDLALDFGHQELAIYLISMGADTSVIGAEFKFDPEKNKKHLQGMAASIKALEEKIKHTCGKT